MKVPRLAIVNVLNTSYITTHLTLYVKEFRNKIFWMLDIIMHLQIVVCCVNARFYLHCVSAVTLM